MRTVENSRELAFSLCLCTPCLCEARGNIARENDREREIKGGVRGCECVHPRGANIFKEITEG